MKKIVFADTNKIYRAFRFWKKDADWLSNSLLYEYIQHSPYEFTVSDYIYTELERIYIRYDGPTTFQEIREFFDALGCITYSIDSDEKKYYIYVNDIHDANIVMDAFLIKADYIRTDNLKDFKLDLIYTELGIQVISKLP